MSALFILFFECNTIFFSVSQIMGINLNHNFIYKSPYLQKNRLDDKNNFKKPLNSSVQFRGLFNPITVQKLANNILPAKIADIPPTLEKKALKLLKRKSDNLADLYIGFKDTFIERIKSNEKFRASIGIDDKTLERINNGSIIAIPESNLLKKFIGNIFAPLKIFSDLYSFTLNSKLGKWAAKNSKLVAGLAAKNAESVENSNIIKNYRSYTGLLDSIKIWEAKQRKTAGISGWDNNGPLLISTEVLESKVLRRWLKSVDPTKGKYQTKHIMLGNRLISGMVYGTFLGNDAYNTTMRYSNNKDEANVQRRSRFAQELSKIGINMYLINLFVGTFEKYVNKSLFHALFMASTTTMTAEILGRKLVGRPIFPSNKETLDEMTKKMEEKKGFWVSVGRMISGTKPKTNKKQPKKNLWVISEQRMPFQGVTKSANTNFKGKNISFGSLYNVTNYMNSKTMKQILNLIEQADPKIYKSYTEIIEKSLKKVSNGKDLTTMLSSEELIPLGTKKTMHGNLLKSIASPYFFLKNMGAKIVSGVKKLFNKSNTTSTLDEMKNKLSKLKSNNPEIEQQYKDYLQKMLSSKLWKTSTLNTDIKETKILSEFLEALEKDTEEIEGVKNIFLFLDKNLKSKDLTKENIENMKKLLFSNFMKTDGAAHVEYDGNTFAMMNINLSRIITTLFLVVDAYNLSMQYNNNDKQSAVNNGKSRALQEASRITVSAYMLAFVHNLLSKFCNSSLFGAFSTTALTSSINDTLARKAVGVPIGTKTHDELLEIDKQNAKSKSPLKRTLAYLIGKRQKQAPQSNSNSNNDFSLYITKSFKSMLD